jgi:hypothetical protein
LKIEPLSVAFAFEPTLGFVDADEAYTGPVKLLAPTASAKSEQLRRLGKGMDLAVGSARQLLAALIVAVAPVGAGSNLA